MVKYIQFRAQRCRNTHLMKKVSNKSCLELNYVPKSPQAYMSISPRSGARELERLIWLKYSFVLKQQNTFTLGLNAAKNTNHI